MSGEVLCYPRDMPVAMCMPAGGFDSLDPDEKSFIKLPIIFGAEMHVNWKSSDDA